MKKSFVGYVYYFDKTFSLIPNENGILSTSIPIFKNKKSLIKRMGNEWGKLAKKINMVVEVKKMNKTVSEKWEEEFEDTAEYYVDDGLNLGEDKLERLFDKYLGLEQSVLSSIKVKIKARKGKIVIERI